MIELRKAKTTDAKVLAELGKKTFLETFSKDNRPEDMALYAQQTFSVEKQASEIMDVKRHVALAWAGDTAVGFCQLLDGTADPCIVGARPIELLRLYVDSDWHGKGVAQALMNECIQHAQQIGFLTLWLGVWERNFKAHAFYRKYSFEVVGSHIFTLGTDDQTDLVMSRSLVN